MRRNVFLLLFLLFDPMSLNAGTYIDTEGFAAECEISGAGMQSGELPVACSVWCKQQYGNTFNGSMVIATQCESLGIINYSYEYCCTNNATLDIVRDCTCDDPHQITYIGKTGGASYKKTLNYDNSYTFTCENAYCFCGNGYYGTRQWMTSSSAGACTRCPCVEDTYATAGTEEQLCGWTNSTGFSEVKENSQAPNSTITNCKIGPITTAIPEQYRTYRDPTGTFIMTGFCQYVQ